MWTYLGGHYSAYDNRFGKKKKSLESGESKMNKGNQLYGDRWKRNFGGEHTVVYTEVKI